MTFLEGTFSDYIFEIAGVLGFLTYVCAYSLLTFQVLTSRCVTYFVLNLCASSLVLFSLVGAFNLAAAMIQSFWIVISLIAIWTRLRQRREAREAARISFSHLNRARAA